MKHILSLDGGGIRGVFTLEVPLGVLTSLIGVPFFLYLVIHTRMGRA